MDKLPPETFNSYLEHAAYEFPTMNHRIKRMGGQSTGIRLIITVPFDGMTEGGQRYIIGPKTIHEQVHTLNWSLWLENKQSPPKFKLREWKVTAGPTKAVIDISLDREV